VENGCDEEVLRRLHAFGQVPMDEAMAGRVLARAARPPRRWWRSTKAKVTAGVVGGFAVGSLGLASAGALPAPVQNAAHDALGVVAVNVPSGHSRYDGPDCGGSDANHGAYVRAHHGGAAAGQSVCGKPTGATQPTPAPAVPGAPTTADEPPSHGQGPPPWAHGNGRGQGQGKRHGDAAEPSDQETHGASEAPGRPSTTIARPGNADASTTIAPRTTAPATTTMVPVPSTTVP
jgi:hypothetical protein